MIQLRGLFPYRYYCPSVSRRIYVRTRGIDESKIQERCNRPSRDADGVFYLPLEISKIAILRCAFNVTEKMRDDPRAEF